MKRERLIDKPFNFSYKQMYNDFPEEMHENLGIPGKFNKKINEKVYLNDGTIMEMDSSYIADPDHKEIFEQISVNVEHQSTPVTKNKIKAMSNYKIQQIADVKLPTLSVIASHIDKEKSEQYYERTPTDITKLHFLQLDEKDNKERLSRLKKIINNNNKISTKDALNIGIIVLFAPEKMPKR